MGVKFFKLVSVVDKGLFTPLLKIKSMCSNWRAQNFKLVPKRRASVLSKKSKFDVLNGEQPLTSVDSCESMWATSRFECWKKLCFVRGCSLAMFVSGRCDVWNPKVDVGLERVVEKSRVGFSIHFHLLKILYEKSFNLVSGRLRLPVSKK